MESEKSAASALSNASSMARCYDIGVVGRVTCDGRRAQREKEATVSAPFDIQ